MRWQTRATLNWNESRTYREEIAVAFARRQAECFVTKPSASGARTADAPPIMQELGDAAVKPLVWCAAIACQEHSRTRRLT